MGFTARYEVTSPSGAKISLLARETAGAPLAAVHISHGPGEDAGHFADFADRLAARGFQIYAHDHRGHGQTRAPDALPGHFGSGEAAQKLAADMGAVQDFIADRHPGLPVILFGHAAGGLIALGWLLRHPERTVAGLVWEDPPARPGPAKRALLAWERFRLGSDMPSRVMVPRASIGSWRAIIAMQDQLERKRDVLPAFGRLTILILGGSAGACDALAGRLRRMGFSDVTLHRRPEAGPDDDIAVVVRDWVESGLD